VDTAVIDISDGVNGYVDLVRHVMKHGKESAPRGLKTREIEDAVVRIENVRDTLPLGVNRGTVPGIGAVEACQLLAGTAFPETLLAVAPQFISYAQDDRTFHGNYGARTDGQYAQLVERLKADPDTRQAVATIWNPQLDLQDGKRDYPCTILHQFRIRDGKLNMSVYMRSNDVWLGAAYDFFQFTRLQIAMASVLGVEPGAYAHHVGSLHIYEQHYDAVDRLEYATEYQPIPVIEGDTWASVKTAAFLALSAATNPELRGALTDSALWYTDAMAAAIQKNADKR
jgi:thymidylate synthase